MPDVRLVDGVRVSDYAQMLVELASLIGLVDLVVVGDDLWRAPAASRRRLR